MAMVAMITTMKEDIITMRTTIGSNAKTHVTHHFTHNSEKLFEMYLPPIWG